MVWCCVLDAELDDKRDRRIGPAVAPSVRTHFMSAIKGCVVARLSIEAFNYSAYVCTCSVHLAVSLVVSCTVENVMTRHHPKPKVRRPDKRLQQSTLIDRGWCCLVCYLPRCRCATFVWTTYRETAFDEAVTLSLNLPPGMGVLCLDRISHE